MSFNTWGQLLRTVFGFIALTASLCSANRVDAVNRTQRMGTLYSRATLIQCDRVSMSALVLSVIWIDHQYVRGRTGAVG